MSEHASAWKTLVDDWVARERDVHPDAPVLPSSVAVRDSIEVGDHVYVLISYDVDVPWPKEEDTSADRRGSNTAVLQARRVRTPWVEEDATRAHAQLMSDDGAVRVSEHVLGPKRAFSGAVIDGLTSVTLHFEGGEEFSAQIVDGWFLAVVPEEWTISAIAGTRDGDAWRADLVRADVPDMIPEGGFVRSAGEAMYFSPLDIRNVVPIVKWERAGDVVAVVTSVEQYDEGGIVRLRVDGIRADEDLFAQWPKVSVDAGGQPLASAVCGEFALADTVTMDIGFRPWKNPDTDELSVTVRGIRGPQGPIDKLTIRLESRRLQS